MVRDAFYINLAKCIAKRKKCKNYALTKKNMVGMMAPSVNFTNILGAVFF
jgi:hypothetical protein